MYSVGEASHRRCYISLEQNIYSCILFDALSGMKTCLRYFVSLSEYRQSIVHTLEKKEQAIFYGKDTIRYSQMLSETRIVEL